MTRSRGLALAATLAAGLTTSLFSPAAPATAAPAGDGPWATFVAGPDGEVQDDFCDVPGLSVDFEFADVVQERWRNLGANDFSYEFYFHDGYEKYTNVETGVSVTLLHAGSSKDVRLIDNGDGTFTRYVTNKGHGVLYSEDGEVLARDAGVFSYSVVYNYAGTPSDPSDDFKVGRPTFLKEQGNSFDFCAVVVGAIG